MRIESVWRNKDSDPPPLAGVPVNLSLNSEVQNGFQGNTRAEHTPVMLREAMDFLRCTPGSVCVDATFGLGGHSLEILRSIQPGGLLLGIDRDREALEIARERLAEFAGSLRLVHDNFKNLPLILNNLTLGLLDGILLDLGVSSYQLLDPERGFSFHSDGLVDMRMDRTQRQTAADLVNELPEAGLADLIRRYGDERFARRIARAIVRARSEARITRCSVLADIIQRAVPSRRDEPIHPATRTFQALRIAVNQELEGLEEFLTEAFSFLRPGGRMVAIAFHSLEDRIIKRSFRTLAGFCTCDRPRLLCTCPRKAVASILTPRPVRPGSQEIDANPRARSARMRVAERLPAPDPSGMGEEE